jgi:DNA-binding transcriptional ArsR family regulator
VVNEIDGTLAVLADPTRRRVVELLGERSLRASEIAERIGVNRPTMSNQLKALLAGGLVDVELSEEDGRARRYRLRPERLAQLSAWLSERERAWEGQLEAFRSHAEHGGRGS